MKLVIQKSRFIPILSSRNIHTTILLCLMLVFVNESLAMSLAASNPGIYWILSGIAGNVSKVTYIGSLKADPELIDFSPLLLKKISMFDLYVESNTMSERIALRSLARVSHNSIWMPNEIAKLQDPHYWISIHIMMSLATEIKNKLIEIDPKHKDTYSNNYRDIILKINNVKNIVDRNLLSVPIVQTLVVVHPSFNYLCNEYHLKQVSISDENSTPGLKKIFAIRNIIIKNKIKVIYSEPQFSTKFAESIIENLSVSIINVNTLSLDWPTMMMNLSSIIATNQKTLSI